MLTLSVVVWKINSKIRLQLYKEKNKPKTLNFKIPKTLRQMESFLDRQVYKVN